MLLPDQNVSVVTMAAPVLAPPAVFTPRIPQNIDELLEQCLLLKGSDLHLAAGAPPTVRVNGVLRPLEGYGILHGAMIERLVFAILNERKVESFTHDLELDTSYSIPGRSRFRIPAPWLPPTTRTRRRRSFALETSEGISKNAGRTGLPVTIAPGSPAAPRTDPTATRRARRDRIRFVRPGTAFCSWMSVGILRAHAVATSGPEA